MARESTLGHDIVIQEGATVWTTDAIEWHYVYADKHILDNQGRLISTPIGKLPKFVGIKDVVETRTQTITQNLAGTDKADQFPVLYDGTAENVYIEHTIIP